MSSPFHSVSQQELSVPTPLKRDIATKAVAVEVVRNILEGKTEEYELVSYSEFRNHHSLRSASYAGYHILCHLNTRKQVGCLICSYLMNDQCTYGSALKKFKTELGTSALRSHTSTHDDKDKKVSNGLAKISKTQKRRVCDAAVHAVVEGLLPISFCYRKGGMLCFANSLVDAGRCVSISTKVYVKDLLPSHTAIRDGIKRMAKAEQERFRVHRMKTMMSYGGGVTCDVLKQNISGAKYYDFTAHYFAIGKPDILTRERDVKLVNRVLLLQDHPGPEISVSIRETLDQALLTRCGIEFESFMKRFTFVTDCASAMPCIVGASSSSDKVPYSEVWMGCISHQLNTAMKHVMKSEISRGTQIAIDLQNVKVIVRIFKQGNWNTALADGYALIQEVETRFGTTNTVVERFLKSVDEVRRIIRLKQHNIAGQSFKALLVEKNDDESWFYPSLMAIIAAFSPLRHTQTALEASKSPTIHHVLPMLEASKRQMRNLATGMVNSSTFRSPHMLTKHLCNALLQELDRIDIHPLWSAGCMLHPRMRGLSFVSNATFRISLKAKGFLLIRDMCRAYIDTNNLSNGDMTSASISSTQMKNLAESCIPSFLGTDGFCIEDAFDTPESQAENITDSFAKYLLAKFTPRSLGLLKSDIGIAKFWLAQEASIPDLMRVALRIFSTPVSSASSERNFSGVNRILTSDRSRMKSDILEDILYLRSKIEGDTYSQETDKEMK